MGYEDKRRIDTPSSSASNLGNSTNSLKPIIKPKGSDVDKPIKKIEKSQQKGKENFEGGNSNAMVRPPKPPRR
jgi:hypothetical protein